MRFFPARLKFALIAAAVTTLFGGVGSTLAESEHETTGSPLLTAEPVRTEDSTHPAVPEGLFHGTDFAFEGPPHQGGATVVTDPHLGVEAEPSPCIWDYVEDPAYAIPFPTSQGGGRFGGDLDAYYGLLFFKTFLNNPEYELLIAGEFPRARYFSVTLYDDHMAPLESLTDHRIEPALAGMVNPYRMGIAYREGQRYLIRVGLGGVPAAFNCAAEEQVNSMEGTGRHYRSLAWQEGLLPQGDHDDEPSEGGAIMIRRYKLDGEELDNNDPMDPANPRLLVRRISDGAFVPKRDLRPCDDCEPLVVTADKGEAEKYEWLDPEQLWLHRLYASKQTQWCFESDDANYRWKRGGPYVPGGNPDTAYVKAPFPHTGDLQALVDGNQVMRLRFKVPATPVFPDAPMDGLEEIRYWSLSIAGGAADSDERGAMAVLTVNDGNVLLPEGSDVANIILDFREMEDDQVLEIGAFLAEQGITYFNRKNIEVVPEVISIRHILPGNPFSCSAENIPYSTQEHNEGGGFMGAYAPIVDFPSRFEAIYNLPWPEFLHEDTCTADAGEPLRCPESE